LGLQRQGAAIPKIGFIESDRNKNRKEGVPEEYCPLFINVYKYIEIVTYPTFSPTRR
jgi:hypothetical protein